MGNTYMPKPENRYPNNVSGFEHIWELDMLTGTKIIVFTFYFRRRKLGGHQQRPK